MSLLNDNAKWIKRGRQRSAVGQVLRKPMTTTEICREAQSFNAHIQLRDVTFLLRQFQAKGLVRCLNPKWVTGKLFVLTDLGREVVESAFAISVRQAARRIDWRKYAWVMRAKIRKVVLLELSRLPEELPKTATVIRKSLRHQYPIGLNPTLRALKELEGMGLIISQRRSAKDPHKTYQVSTSGAAIVRQILH